MEFPELEVFMQQPDEEGKNGGQFSKRFKCQVLSIHVTAFYLMPTNRTVCMPPGHEKDVYNYFHHYMNSEEDYQTLIDEFWDFRLKENVFHHTWICWEHQGIPYKFWRNVATHMKMIRTFAS